MVVSTEQTWREMSHKLRHFFRRRVADEQLAEDLLQETFVRIHNGLASLKEQERLAAWVYRVAHNTLVDYFRKGFVSKEVLTDTFALPENPPEENSNAEIVAGLRRLVQQLPPNYRSAMELAELQEVTQREVSERLGLSLSGAKSRVQRGREKLKELLLRCCHFELDRQGNVVDYQPQKACSGCCTASTATPTLPVKPSQPASQCCG